MTIDKAIDLLDNLVGMVEDSQENDYDEALNMGADALKRQQMMRGTWRRGRGWSEGCGMGEQYGYYYTCSLCGHEVQGGYGSCGYNFCSYCGADMRGKE